MDAQTVDVGRNLIPEVTAGVVAEHRRVGSPEGAPDVEGCLPVGNDILLVNRVAGAAVEDLTAAPSSG